MATKKKSLVEFIHDEGYGEHLVDYINIALRGKDMQATKVVADDSNSEYSARLALRVLLGAIEYEFNSITHGGKVDLGAVHGWIQFLKLWAETGVKANESQS